jgi:hypothetical protein
MTPFGKTGTVLITLTIAFLLVSLGAYLQGPRVEAQSNDPGSWYFEPGVHPINIPNGGQVMGKIAIDLHSGNIWGFPTNSNLPYPQPASMGARVTASHGIPLGHFALEDAYK